VPAIPRILAACGALGLLLLGLAAAGGAASRPGGLWLGVPSAAGALAVAVSVAALYGLARGHLAVAAGLLALPILLVAGAPLGALSGPPLFAVALAGAVAALALARPRFVAPLFFPVVWALYTAMAAGVQARVGPNGDEPHYLMVAESLWRDGDLDLTRDYAEGRYRAFHPEPLQPHYRVRGRHGEIYSLHSVGLSLLVLPVYVLFGYAGASFFMAFLAALVARETRLLLRDMLADPQLADGVAWVLALSPPLVHYAGLLFTEIPAALLVVTGLRGARKLRTLPPAWSIAWGAALGFLPWLNVRYAPLPVIILCYALVMRPGPRAALLGLAPGVVSLVSLAAYHFVLYGFFDPRGVYGRRPELGLGLLGEGVPGLLLDQEFGLLVYAPVFALAVPGWVQLARKSRAEAAVVAGMVVVVVVTAGSWPMWRGGFNPPARFLVPIVPALALAMAADVARGLRSAGAVLIGWGLWTGLAGLAAPELLHRDRDGTAPFFRVHSGAVEWTRLLPGYVLGEENRRPLAVLWGLTLLGAVTLGGRRASARGLLVSSGGLALAGHLAAGLSARHEARDALRVVGRPALAVPGWRYEPSATALWGPESLVWGALYEPHRHADGAILVDRTALATGQLEIDVDPSLPPGDPPQLDVRLETQPPRGARYLLRYEEGRLVGAFDTAGFGPAAAPRRLALVGGGPLLVEQVRLSTPPPADGPSH